MAARVRPSRTKPDAKTSAADSRPSATTAVEWPQTPATILTIASVPLTAIPATATRWPDCMNAPARSGARRVAFFRVHSEFAEGRERPGSVELAVARQARQGRRDDRFGVDL